MTFSPSPKVGNVSTPQLARQRGQTVLRGPDPLTPDLDDVAAADVLVEHPAADAIAGLHDDHGRPGVRRGTGRRQAGQAGPDHHQVGVAGLLVRHRAAEP